ncbi:MAG: hypothetical protein HC846_14430 [Blastocatellia bacterium]|nr:hypothetical protein [Blastocatellia bacterium]
MHNESGQHPLFPDPGVQGALNTRHDAALTATGAIIDATIGKATIEAKPIFLTTSHRLKPAK